MFKFLKGQGVKKEEGEMKRLGAVIFVLVLGLVIAPMVGYAYEVTSAIYNGAGVLAQERTYDITTPNTFKTIIHYDGYGLRLFLEGNGDQGYYTTSWQYNGTKMKSVMTGGNGMQDYKGIYDSTGQVAYEYYTELANGTWIGDAIKDLAIFLGDPEGNHVAGDSDPNAPVPGAQAVADLAYQRAGGLLLLDSGLLNSITNSETDTHSGMNFALGTGHFIKSYSADTNGDGVLDRSYAFKATANNWATGSNRISLYLSDISQKNNAGGPTGFTFNGKSFAGDVHFASPDQFHDTGTKDPNGNQIGHWDPAITVTGTLGKDNNGFYIIDSNGSRKNIEVLDSNLANQLAGNVGGQISVTGDVTPNDSSTISLQEFSVV